jgi:hypothetical protein
MKQALFVLLLATAGGSAEAQGTAVEPTPTVRVRLNNNSRVEGFLRGRSADELVVYTSDGQYRRVPFSDVRRFEIHSHLGSHWKRGALLGLLMAAGVIVTAPIDSLDEAGAASWQSALVVAGGTGLGAVIGSTIPRHGWRTADPRSAWSSRAPGIQFTLRF